MHHKLSPMLCTLILLLLCVSAAPVAGKPGLNLQRTPSGIESSPHSFELPANLPVVEAIHPLSEGARAQLRAQGFVALPDQDIEYLSAAYFRLFPEEQVSVFITADMALHIFHNVFDDLLSEVEKTHLTDDVAWLVQQLYAASDIRYAATPGSQPLSKAAARHNVLVFGVAARLLDDNVVFPDYIEPDAGQYVQKVLDHTATEFYPGDDYTQYEPRGHYAGDEALERYFRAVKWLSRRIFRIEDRYFPADADVELTAAALLAQLIADAPDIEARWNEVYDVTRLLAGPADSITPPMVQQALDNVFGPAFTLDMLEDAANRAALRAEFQRDIYPTSEIIPVPLAFPDQIPQKYVQFLGERYLPDGEAMHHTTFPHVPERLLPSGLDVMATVLASDRAEHWLAEDIAAYPELAAQITALRAQFDAYTVDDWTKSTYNGWLYALRPLLQPMPAGAPAFMQGTAWQDKGLNTALGSWTQLRHDFILYGKPTYVPCPWAFGPGLVEAVPATFDRLADLCDQVHGALDGYEMLPEVHGRNLHQLATKLRSWRDYAQTVADGDWLTEEEQGDIHRVGLWLVEFFAEGWGVEEKSPLLVADVASDSNTGRVLHEGTGLFNPLIVVYTPPDGEPIAGIGYVFSHYEFAEPDWNRLNDAEWAGRLQGDPPPRPAWTSDLLPLHPSETVHWPFKSVTPTGTVACGDELTYTLAISAVSGTQLGLYDPLTDTTFQRFVEPVEGITHTNRAITGTLMVTPTNQITLSFVVQVDGPGTLGWTGDVTNRACVYPFSGTLGGCVWSNEVTNPAFRPYETYLPMVLRPWTPAPHRPTLSPISNDDGDDFYSVSWTEQPSRLADTYTLQEATDAAFTTGLREVCTTDGESCRVGCRPARTYYYRVRGCNTWGCGLWSDVQATMVTIVRTPPLTRVTCWVSDPTPRRDITVTVYGKLTVMGSGISDVPMEAEWDYGDVTRYCYGTTGSDGIASCSRDISEATAGNTVNIYVTMSKENPCIEHFRCTTSFVPHD